MRTHQKKFLVLKQKDGKTPSSLTNGVNDLRPNNQHHDRKHVL